MFLKNDPNYIPRKIISSTKNIMAFKTTCSIFFKCTRTLITFDINKTQHLYNISIFIIIQY